jgi:hypothetical protein
MAIGVSPESIRDDGQICGPQYFKYSSMQVDPPRLRRALLQRRVGRFKSFGLPLRGGSQGLHRPLLEIEAGCEITPR